MAVDLDSIISAGLTRRTALKGLGATSLVAFAGTAALGSAAAQDATPAAADYPTVEFTAEDMKFVGLPATMPGGFTRLTMMNNGPSDHHAMFMRIVDGRTPDDFGAAMQTGDLGQLLAISTSLGGPGSVGAGESSTLVVDLMPGQYMVVCLIPDESSGLPHAAMGMITPIEVTAAAAALEAPVTEVMVDLADFQFIDLPTELAAGPHVWDVTTTGAQLHELVIYKQAEGVTYEMVEAIFSAPPEASPEAGIEATPEAAASPEASGPPPFVAVTGVAPLTPGGTNYLELDLEAGNYFAICFIPDPATGAPHFALGMIMPFTVA